MMVMMVSCFDISDALDPGIFQAFYRCVIRLHGWIHGCSSVKTDGFLRAIFDFV